MGALCKLQDGLASWWAGCGREGKRLAGGALAAGAGGLAAGGGGWAAGGRAVAGGGGRRATAGGRVGFGGGRLRATCGRAGAALDKWAEVHRFTSGTLCPKMLVCIVL